MYPMNERGVAGITMALLMTCFIACIGLSADVGNAVLQRARVQNVVDSAALSIARDCALKNELCTPEQSVSSANRYATGNASGAEVQPVEIGASSVKVKAGKDVRTNFLYLLGIDSKIVNATATASWDQHPVEGFPVLPFGVPLCSVQENLPPKTTPFVLRSNVGSPLFHLAQKDKTIDKVAEHLTSAVPAITESCTHPDFGAVTMLSGLIWLSDSTKKGGEFNWNSSACNMKVPSIDSIIETTTSSAIPANCMDKFGDKIRVGTVVMTPIYAPSAFPDRFGLELVSGKPRFNVKVVGFAPFKITGWNMSGESGGGPGTCSGVVEFSIPSVKNITCDGISGYFVNSIQADPDFTYSHGGADFGASGVKLSE